MLQKMILELLNKKHGDLKYRELVELTGIEKTRLFRIKNGSPMKLDEFEKFLKAFSSDNCLMETTVLGSFLLEPNTLVGIMNNIRKEISRVENQKGEAC